METAVTFGRAMGRAIRDSNETQALMVVEDISSAYRMDHLVGMMHASSEGQAVLADRPRIDSSTIERDELSSLPRGTLGREFVEHLRHHLLDPDLLTTPCTRARTPETRFMLERVRQTHDIWHVVLGLGAQAHEEVLLHTFQWAQLRMPYSALILLFGTVKHLIGEARWNILRHTMRGGYQAGRRASPLLSVYWERHWEDSIPSLRERLGVIPSNRWGES
ncbi:Coenzyme Q (ubiquinone) biosynthesis protein Coq4 [Enhygromyxa salina]|uniref:Coenzyme Q (Ubiquinone) biosynthesis protein Coq4 n=2 Tax=Enhygromyxa salina TaxID=215803 RepID=A0A2S9YP18_9BACT|nr:Coenzyme Q (ubiquinone) biosynthesis protein Coq4 [Enhygromyxa salina]